MGLFDRQSTYNEAKAAMELANQVKEVADSLAGQDLTKDTPRIREKVEKLEELTGSKRKAKKAVEDSTLSGGAKQRLFRGLMRGW